MDTDDAILVISDARIVADAGQFNGLSLRLGDLLAHYRKLAEREESLSKELEALWSGYRKLAEREKALTEALEAMLREFGHESVQRTPMTRDEHAAIHLSKAALALHKEDA